MILQALYEYYLRKPDLPGPGFEEKEIPFLVILDEQGLFVQIEDTREGQGKNKDTKRFLVPQGVKRASNVLPNLLWDNASYVLGVDIKGKPERLNQQAHAFQQAISDLMIEQDRGVTSVLRFLNSPDQKARAVAAASQWPEILRKAPISRSKW